MVLWWIARFRVPVFLFTDETMERINLVSIFSYQGIVDYGSTVAYRAIHHSPFIGVDGATAVASLAGNHGLFAALCAIADEITMLTLGGHLYRNLRGNNGVHVLI